MTPNIDATYITNTLSYIHLLPIHEQDEELCKILDHFNINFKRNSSSISYYKLLKKVIMLINKYIYIYIYMYI